MIKVGVSVILFDVTNRCVLIGKRRGSHGEGMYSIPGGHLEDGEPYYECCARELLEETGIDLKNNWDYNCIEHYDFSEDFFGDKQYTTLYFLIRLHERPKVVNREPDKCEGWEWINIEKQIPANMFCHTSEVLTKLQGELL